MKIESLEINGIKYNLKIYYEKRKNTTASIINNNVNIRISLSLGREEQFKSLIEMKQWAINKIKENPERLKSKIQRTYKDKDIIKIWNEEYLLRINFMNKSGSSARIKDKGIYLNISNSLPEEVQNKHISSLVSRVISSKKLPELKERINGLNRKYFNKEINKIFFKNHKSKWGSCSNSNNINISTRLLFAPEDIMDYVCIHELAHLIEKNHSKNFWKLVESVMPDYKDKIKWLKENRHKLSF